MYSIADYGSMIADRVRMDAFHRALRQAIRPGCAVVDIGTGTGIFALLACQAGARRVYAIEPDDAIAVARELARANGVADRIEFIQADSTAVTLPERAAVIISDIGGILPWFRRHIPSIVDARQRFLAPEGVLVPQQDRVWAAVVDAPELYARDAGPWRENPFGLDMEAARRLVVNSIEKGRVTREQLLTRPEVWATVDYRRVGDVNVRGRISRSAERDGTGHGFVAGFDRVVLDGIELSNAPDAPDGNRPQRIYGTLFFPWSEAVPLEAGDVVTIEIEGTLVVDDYVWSWTTRVQAGEDTSRLKASFRQSTFFGAPLSVSRLRKRAATYQPRLSADGTITRFVLDQMTGGAPLGEIAQHLAARFSERFRSPLEALLYVADISQQYSAGEER